MLLRMLRDLVGGRSPSVPAPLRSAASAPKLPARSEPGARQAQNFFVPMFWGTKDEAKVAESVQAVTELLQGGSHFADNLLTWGRNLSMLDDAPFVASWQANAENSSDQAIVWRRYVLACAAYHCVQLDGDFVECGAYTGVGIKTVVDYLGGPAFPKVFWGYDRFDHDPATLNHQMPELGPGLHARVLAKFAAYPNVRIMRGPIPEVFAGGCPERIAYLHIDLNQAPAEIAALEVLFDRMVPGGILILDDYEWAGVYRGQKLAEDPWFDSRKYRVMPLPTGQGLVIRR